MKNSELPQPSIPEEAISWAKDRIKGYQDGRYNKAWLFPDLTQTVLVYLIEKLEKLGLDFENFKDFSEVLKALRNPYNLFYPGMYEAEKRLISQLRFPVVVPLRQVLKSQGEAKTKKSATRAKQPALPLEEIDRQRKINPGPGFRPTEEIVLDRVRQEEIRDGIQGTTNLTLLEKEIFISVYVRGKSYKQAAEEFNIKPGRVTGVLIRCKKVLEMIFQPEMKDY